MIILQTNNLSKHYDGVAAVDGLSLNFEQGKIIGLIGPNGSGKTTLINMLSGMIPANSGVVIVSGLQLLKLRPQIIFNHGITRTFQEVRLFNQMTVLDNLLVVMTEQKVLAALFEKHNREHVRAAEELLKKINLWDKRDSLAWNLSYGQRKLLEIGRAAATTAQIYLFDEPFAGLFPEMVKIVKDLMLEMKAEGKTIILIEHDMALIRELSNYVYVLDAGKLLAQGRPAEVLSQSEVIEAYLGA